jgi:hypothetical protein
MHACRRSNFPVRVLASNNDSNYTEFTARSVDEFEEKVSNLFVFSDALEQFRVERLRVSAFFWPAITENFKEEEEEKHFRSMPETSDRVVSMNVTRNIM